jgi:polysaccharide deacetylase 2 family uncharacterized protein YibQ
MSFEKYISTNNQSWLKTSISLILTCFLFITSLNAEQKKEEKLSCRLEVPISKEWAKKHYKKRCDGDDIRLCVIVNNFGLIEKKARSLLRIMPEAFSLAISPYKLPSQKIMKSISNNGHNIIFLQPVAPYRNTHSTQDPYRMSADYEPSQNKGISLKTTMLIPKDVVGVMVDEISSLLKDKNSLSLLLENLKEKKLPLILPEMPLDNESRSICESMDVEIYEADYYISKFSTENEASETLNRLKDLLLKTGYALLVIDEDIEKISTLIDWLQLFLKDQPLKLISFKEVLNDKNLS